MSDSMMRVTASLALYVAWSFVLWNGPGTPVILQPGNAVAAAQIAQALFTALGALAVALCTRKVAPLRHRTALLGVLAVASSASSLLASCAWSSPSLLWPLVLALAVSGAASTLRLGIEESVNAGGPRAIAMCVSTAYVIGFVLFSLVSVLPGVTSFYAAAVMPLVSWATLFLRRPSPCTRHERGPSQSAGYKPDSSAMPSLRALFDQVPLRLLVLVGIAFFGYGAMRASGVTQGMSLGAPLVTGLPALASLVGVVLAFQLRNASLSRVLYASFALMAVASLLPVAAGPGLVGVAFCTALTGAELIKYVTWFFLARLLPERTFPAILFLAMSRFAQWSGSLAGQVAALFSPTPETLSMATLLSLVVALLTVAGHRIPSLKPQEVEQPVGPRDERRPHSGSKPDPMGTAQDAVSADDSPRHDRPGTVATSSNGTGGPEGASEEGRTRLARLAAARYRLTPRELDVLSVWMTGHTISYVEKALFISKNTVKTHLNHIYSKTGTNNREELLELLESMDDDTTDNCS